MGLLIDGVWHDKWYDTGDSGKFKREKSGFRDWVTADGSSGFPAEPNRYHLYVSLACPWAHRTLIFRKLKKLEDAISVSVVHWHMGEYGWSFEDAPGATGDHLYGCDHLHQIYTKAKSDYTGRVTVPVLWDKKTETIVSNESAEIIRMLNAEFDAFGEAGLDFYPEDLRAEIDEVNERIYHTVNNGVYKAGFATKQQAYEEAFDALFESLDWLEDRLADRRFLCGGRLTEADWRLFTTLVRFDPVYHGHFKCNRQRLAEFPNLWGYTRDLYQVPGVAQTVDQEHIKKHYYTSHPKVNPSRIVPKGPQIDYAGPHGREAL